jgi:hypothetical protein
VLDEAEVQQLGHVVDLAALAGDDVTGLDVPVNQADGMGFA